MTPYETMTDTEGSWLQRYAEYDRLDQVPPAFRVIRDEWDTTTDLPQRTILELKLV